ncbi:hypothetical protein GCM10010193_15270 [Kitasatospora atroaurantiaca]|uniref:Putative pyrroloquinoline-quinone-binding quinoprotein n=1 Tax=Kitasatospora atroaurantiaca TaxID=285545 RepID=A0A561EII2_9ACTN|nr:PQQ-binding-like beta-propeller repeat protein [Kitasatospora atroaurantiaca]TWE15414.1 putative pyrroloquinoline-quinone-binding quinoprotein [Kitasatospora atroaurantiaca]
MPRRRSDTLGGVIVAALLALLPACATKSGQGPEASSTSTHSPEVFSTGGRTATPAAEGDWPTYHRDAARTGTVPGRPPVRGLTKAWSAALDGAVYGQPLVVGARVLAATENNTVYALDAGSGSVLWSRHLGSPARRAELPCGNIDPLGITGTPVYDPTTGLVFAVAELAGGSHVLAGLDAATGEVVVRRGLDPPKGEAVAHQQRAALTLLNGRVVVAYGGLFGDCGRYVGSVLSAPVTGAGPVRSYAVPTTREGGIWAPGGPVVDGSRLLVSVGNGEATGGTFDGSDSVLALSEELQRTDFFAPSTWAEDNAADLDLGSLSPVRVGAFVLAVGKRGTGYVLDPEHLGGIGGERSQAKLCPAYGGAAVSGSTVYLPCQDELLEVTVTGDGTLHTGWRMPLNGSGSPVVGGGAVWVVDYGRGQLYALNPSDGRVLQQTSTGPLPHFVSPVLTGGLVLLGTMAGVTAFGTG